MPLTVATRRGRPWPACKRIRESPPEDRALLQSASAFLGKLISVVRRLQKAGLARDLPATKSETLHGLIVSLGRIQGRIQSETLEL